MVLYFFSIIIKNLFLTVLIESILSFFIGIRNINNIKVIALTNVITNISLSFISIVLVFYYKDLYGKSIVLLEGLIIFIEAYVFSKKLNREDVFFNKNFIKNNFFVSFLLSIILNTVTIFLSRYV